MTNKDTNSQDSIQVGNESIQTNTLGTTMEERFDKEFHKKGGMYENNQPFDCWNSFDGLRKDIKIFINQELTQSKTDLLNALIEREESGSIEFMTPDKASRQMGYNQKKQDIINHLKSLRDE